MKPAPPRFNNDDIRLLQALRMRGWNYANWYELDDSEQTDILAYETWREQQLNKLSKQLTDIQSFDAVASQVLVILAQYG